VGFFYEIFVGEVGDVGVAVKGCGNFFDEGFWSEFSPYDGRFVEEFFDKERLLK